MFDDGFPIPTRLLQRICSLRDGPETIALCPDFEAKNWRFKRLSDHVFDWLPDVALKTEERRAMLFESHKTLVMSCNRMFKVDDASKRGEIGEVLLHAACRQEYNSIPVVARLFYKMRTNDSVTSVDVVHIVYRNDKKDIELWLGEAKLYESIQEAKYKALKSIEPLWNNEFLSEMKALVGPKIQSSAKYAQALDWLFADETSLDQIISRLVIPICIACDFPATALAETRSADYIAKIESELVKIQEYFDDRVPVEIQIVCIFIPLDSKEKLETIFNEKIRTYL